MTMRMSCSEAAVHGFFRNTALAVRRLGAMKVTLRPSGRISPNAFAHRMRQEGFAVACEADNLPLWKRTEADYCRFVVAVVKATP
jgi:hypothetical protein